MSLDRPRALIFDLDGTLVDSVNAICGVGNALLAQLDLPPMSVTEARGYIGHGVPNFVKRSLGARGVTMKREHIGQFKSLYDESDGGGNPPFDGVERLLDRCAAEGLPIGLCTNKPAIPTLNVLRSLEWETRFASVVAGDTLEVRKPDPAPLLHAKAAIKAESADLLYVGDSEVDAQTAQNAGVQFALFTEGYRKTPVAEIPHDLAFSSYEVLIEEIFGS